MTTTNDGPIIYPMAATDDALAILVRIEDYANRAGWDQPAQLHYVHRNPEGGLWSVQSRYFGRAIGITQDTLQALQLSHIAYDLEVLGGEVTTREGVVGLVLVDEAWSILPGPDDAPDVAVFAHHPNTGASDCRLVYFLAQDRSHRILARRRGADQPMAVGSLGRFDYRGGGRLFGELAKMLAGMAEEWEG